MRDADTFLSHSGQIVVHGSVRGGFRPRPSGTNVVPLIEAEPQIVALMGERVSRALSQDLQVPGTYRDKIHVTVFDWVQPGQLIGLLTQIHTDGFQYKLTVPRHVEGPKLLKGLLQVLLLEYANRGSRRAAELPNWLVEGMLRQIQTTVVPTYVVNRKPMTIETSGYDRLGATRDYLQTNTPMTLQELSFTDLTKVTMDERAQFEASSHLLAHQLLRLKDGPALMARFLQTLPHTLNWQTAFYSVYQKHFRGALEFEKWWMLQWVEFKNGRGQEGWPLPVTMDRLESVLLTAMEVRADAGSIPVHREASLQEFLQLADFPTQKELLGQKLQQMFFMSLSVPKEALSLWMAYQRAIENYLQKRGVTDTQPLLKNYTEQRMQDLVRSTVQTLNELDVARAELKAGRVPVISRDLARQASR
ncbi:MAG: hypothetical protein ACXW32_10220 [Limisphaerales bacterium]